MIAASDSKEYVPFGRQQIKNHPGKVVLQTEQAPPVEGLVQKLSQVNIQDAPQDEFWIIRNCDVGNESSDVYKEEELYVSGHTAVLSKGIAGKRDAKEGSSDVLVACYTMESSIKQALFCNFIHTDKNSENVPIPSLCLIDSTRITVYTESGEDYIAPLQFQVSTAWSTKFGLLLERVSLCPNADEFQPDTSMQFTPTTIFSLVHPLHEISPLLAVKQSGHLSYMTDTCLRIVYTCDEPSICVLVDLRSGLHSLWKLRQATQKEVQLMSSNDNNTTLNAISMSNCSNLSSSFVRLSQGRPSMGKTMFFPCVTNQSSPLSSSCTSLSGFYPGSPIFHSPAISRVSGFHSRRTSKSPYGNVSNLSMDARLATSQIFSSTVAPKPIVPEICLEHMWSDLPPSRTSTEPMVDIKKPEGKVFLTTDLLGQQYLCYPSYVRHDTLICARLTRTNSEINPDFIVGSGNLISAKNAVSVSALKMMVILEPSGSIVLYSGPVPIGKISLAGVTAELASSSYLKASALSSTMLRNNFRRMSMLSSTVLPGEGGFFEDRHQLLSPVVCTPEPHQFRRMASSTPGTTPPVSPLQPIDHILSLRDPVGFSFSVEFQNGSLFRISLPEISSSPLVEECIRVLKWVLMKDDALQTLTKWYSVRNAPGTQDISPDLEWKHFISTLLELLGYELESLFLMQQYINSDCDTPAKNTKKRRASDLGTLEDWEYVKNSSCSISAGLAAVLNVPSSKPLPPYEAPSKTPLINTGAPLFQYMYSILFSFHLLYEELKLNTLMTDCLPFLARFLHQLSWDLKLDQYIHHYWLDFPQYCPLHISTSQVDQESLSLLMKPAYITAKPPSVFGCILSLIESPSTPPYPYITNVNNYSKNIVLVIGVIKRRDASKVTVHVSPPGSRGESALYNTSIDLSPERQAVLLMHSLGLKKEQIDVLPCSVGLILADTLQTVCEDPLPGWDPEVYELIGRLDMVPSHINNIGLPSKKRKPAKKDPDNSENPEPTRNIHHILSLRFNKDQRVLEVVKLLESHEPVTVNITQRAEVTDHEFIEEQERHLYTLCNRTMALPVGRGMMELHTEEPMTNEPLAIPKICLHGRAPPCGTRVDLSQIEVVPNMTLWPMFHNGVAAGLRIPPSAKNVSSNWILFNKPKDPSSDFLPEHAGFLMALGLTGHLNRFNEYRLYEYLTKCHEMTSIGLLLGIAASKRGTMEVRFKKMFSVHIESLLPSTSIELDIFQNVQVAALVGIGLLYQGTGHRHIAEVLLSEIGRPPGPEMENSTDRECYSLAAGLGLGLVVLRKGANPSGLQDLAIAETLHHYMVGGPKRPLTGSQKEKYKSPSYQIREEDRVNNNVTAPGAILALGLMYFNTGNRAVASWLEAPQSEYMLGFVCPDLLLLRIIAHGLIMWDDVQPSLEWVESHVPVAIKPYCFTKPKPDTDDIDYETMNQAFVNLISGACFVLGLKFAGSANEQAFQTLHQVCCVLLSLSGKSIAELAGKSTIETCLNVVLISLAMVMCGTGDLEVVRLCRYLRMRVANSVVTYGSHLATHMALGLLFLGGGAYTLSTTPESVAALICAFFPRFPTHSNDNRYHLQALRHLYVLAAEPRLILPKDIETGDLCYANLTVVFLDTPHYKDQKCRLFAPCLLPELRFLKEVRIDDDRYWPVVFLRDKNWNLLENLMKNQSCVGVKLRAGCLPHVEDPHGYRTLLARSLSTNQASAWAKHIDSVLAYTSDQVTNNLVKNLLELAPGSIFGARHLQYLTRIAYECVTRDKLPLLRLWIHIVETTARLELVPDCNLVWQLKIILSHGCDTASAKNYHMPPDLFLFLKHCTVHLAAKWEKDLADKISFYLNDQPVSGGSLDLSKLTAFLVYYGIPCNSLLNDISSNQSNPLQNQLNIKSLNISYETLKKINQFKS